MALEVTPVNRNLHQRVTFMMLEFEDLFVVMGLAALMNVVSHFVSGTVGGIPMSALLQYGVPLSVVPLLMIFKYGNRLLSAGCISVSENLDNGSTVYRITRRGLIQLESFGRFATVLNSRTQHLPHPSQVPHALELNAVQLELTRKNLLLSWKSDIEIASMNTISTRALEKDYDAIVDVWNDKIASRFALEYERTLKSAQQYEKVRRALETEDKLGCVLYLTAGEEICLHLANELTGIPKRLAFATARDFREYLLDTMVMISPGQPRVSFRSLLCGMF